MLPSNASKVHVSEEKRAWRHIMCYIIHMRVCMYVCMHERCMYAVHVAKPYKGNHAATVCNKDETMTWNISVYTLHSMSLCVRMYGVCGCVCMYVCACTYIHWYALVCVEATKGQIRCQFVGEFKRKEENNTQSILE